MTATFLNFYYSVFKNKPPQKIKSIVEIQEQLKETHQLKRWNFGTKGKQLPKDGRKSRQIWLLPSLQKVTWLPPWIDQKMVKKQKHNANFSRDKTHTSKSNQASEIIRLHVWIFKAMWEKIRQRKRHKTQKSNSIYKQENKNTHACARWNARKTSMIITLQKEAIPE